MYKHMSGMLHPILFVTVIIPELTEIETFLSSPEIIVYEFNVV